MRFIDLCSGIGGSRAGLEDLGWKSVLSVDSNQNAVAVHRLAFGDCLGLEVSKLDSELLPEFDVLVAGFPCQPFSSSGSKTGFKHHSGNVFLEIMSIINDRRPPILLFENVVGLLRNQYGYSMACILATLTKSKYEVEWLTIDTKWLGIPQSRARVFILAQDTTAPRLKPLQADHDDLFGTPRGLSVLGKLIDDIGGRKFAISTGSLEQVESERRPRIGVPKPKATTPFLSGGIAFGDTFHTYRVKVPETFPGGLAEICSPKFRRADAVRSVRYYARGGPTLPTFRNDAIAHCLGTNIGAGPTFGVPLDLISNQDEEKQVLEYANWSRRQAGRLVFRLVPERAVRLFGPGVERIEMALSRSSVPITHQYVLIGNLIAPLVARTVGSLIQDSLKE
jgi:site-specific DNA-cytosine methylase